MKKVLTLLVALLLFSCSEGSKKVELRLTDYGAVVDDATHDNATALLDLLEDAHKASAEGKEVVIYLPKGNLHIYQEHLPLHQLYISNHDHVVQRPVAMMLEGLNNVSIQGEETHLEFHGRLIPIVLKESSNIHLEGFSIDFPRPAMSQIEVLEVDKEHNDAKVKVLGETEYRIEGNQFVLIGETHEQPLFTMLAFDKDGHMKWNRSDPTFNPEAIEETGDHQLQLRNWDEAQYLEVGDRYALRSYYRPTPSIVIMDSKTIEVKNISVHFAEGMGLVAQNSTDLTLDGFHVALSDGSERVFTTVADATHFSGCRGKIISTDGLYENMADDAINVHGTYLRVDSINGNELIGTFAHGQSFGFRWYEVGDSLRLISRETLLPIATYLPTKVEVLSTTQIKMTFSEPLPQTSKALAVENLTAHPEVLFSKSTVRNNRARGALFSTPKRVECTDNTFDHTHGSAILLTGDANGWYESGPCEEVVITGNHFINALTSLYQFTDGIISVSPQMPQMVEGEYFHGRVVVENNVFDNFPTPIFYAKSLRELVFKNNTININNDYTSLFEDPNARLYNVGTYISDDPNTPLTDCKDTTVSLF